MDQVSAALPQNLRRIFIATLTWRLQALVTEAWALTLLLKPPIITTKVTNWCKHCILYLFLILINDYFKYPFLGERVSSDTFSTWTLLPNVATFSWCYKMWTVALPPSRQVLLMQGAMLVLWLCWFELVLVLVLPAWVRPWHEHMCRHMYISHADCWHHVETSCKLDTHTTASSGHAQLP